MNLGEEPVPEDKFEDEVCAHITVIELTEMIGSFKDDRAVPEEILTGKMTLIPKKADSAKVTDRRPLTVSSICAVRVQEE